MLRGRSDVRGARRLGCWLGGLLVGVYVCAGGGVRRAAAHPQFAISTVNRYGKLVLMARPGDAAGHGAPVQVRAFYTLMVGDAPARGLRERADRDGSGTLDAGEQAALGAELRAAIADGVRLERLPAGAAGTGTGEATPLPLVWELTPGGLGDARVGPYALSVEASAQVTLPPAASGPAQDLRYEDRVALAPVGEVELRIEEGPGVRALWAVQGAGDPPATEPPRPLVLQTYGPPRSSLSDRSIRVRIETLGPPSPPQQQKRAVPPLGALLGLGAVLAAGLGGLLWVRARRRS